MGIQVNELTLGKSPWEKEFIDFEFDGKFVSEFGLVVVSDGDRLSMDLSAPFNDETSEVNGVDGQLFWGTKRNASRRQFKLATDGMSLKDISAFKQHFQPGRYGKLIEDSEFGKYCYARVAEQPVFSHIPFKKSSTFNKVNFNTNEFKGEITLTFVMDSPWKYGVKNYVNIEEEQEKVRLMAHQNIPFATSWQNESVPCVIGDINSYLTYNGVENYTDLTSPFCFYNPSEIDAVAKLQLSFTVTNDGEYYNFIPDENWSVSSEPYCRIMQSKILFTNEGENGVFDINSATEIFRFCSPYAVYSMNQAIKIIKSYGAIDNTNFIKVEEQLRDEIHHNAVLQWCMTCIRREIAGFGMAAKECLLFFNSNVPFTIIIDSEKGTCKCSYSYAKNYKELEDGSQEVNFLSAEENCGDITLSENLKLKGGTFLNDSGQIASYYQMALYNEGTINGTANIKLEYKYTYL